MIGETRVRFPLALPIPHRVTGPGRPRATTRNAPAKNPPENTPVTRRSFGLVRAQAPRVAPSARGWYGSGPRQLWVRNRGRSGRRMLVVVA
jgi:hypothetical protein